MDTPAQAHEQRTSPQPAFTFRRRVAYYETDAMGIVHHSNYIRYFEDARVEWMRQSGLIALHVPQGPFVFAVHEVSCSYRRPLRFNDEFVVSVVPRLEGVRLQLTYEIACENFVCASGATTLVPLDANFKPARLPAHAKALFHARA